MGRARGNAVLLDRFSGDRHQHAGDVAAVRHLGAVAVVAVPVCEAGEKLLGRTDPGEVNFDEFAVMPICFSGLGDVIAAAGSDAHYWLLAGFVLFRLFDIAKPLGIRELQKLKGGWGVVADDFAAAALTCVCLWCGHFALEKFF